MDLSVIVPFYNEEDNIRGMHEALCAALAPLELDYEIIFVDDGSSDRTFRLARELAAQDPHLRVIKFRKNYGQTPAMMAGIDNARGDILITMDGDLQNDPADIPHFLDKIREGYDIVVGWRHKRQDKLITRKIPSRIANYLIGKVTGVPIKDNGCSLKAYRANVIRNVPLYSEMHRFIPAMLSLTGARIAEIKVRHHPRRFGVSKYGLTRIYKVLSDLLTIKMLVSFASRPLRWYSILALPLLAVGTLACGYALYMWIQAPETGIMVPLGVGMVLFSAILFLLFCGILGEFIYRTGDYKTERLSRITYKVTANHE